MQNVVDAKKAKALALGTMLKACRQQQQAMHAVLDALQAQVDAVRALQDADVDLPQRKQGGGE